MTVSSHCHFLLFQGHWQPVFYLYNCLQVKGKTTGIVTNVEKTMYDARWVLELLGGILCEVC